MESGPTFFLSRINPLQGLKWGKDMTKEKSKSLKKKDEEAENQ
jgi:hypothetical protein